MVPPATHIEPATESVLRRMRAALLTGQFHIIVKDFLRAYQRGHVSPEAYTILLQACSRLGDAQTAGSLLRLAAQKGVKLPPEAHMNILHAAAKGPDRINVLVKHLSLLDATAGDASSSHMMQATGLFVAKILLLEGGAHNAGIALSILDGIESGEGSSAEHRSTYDGLRLLALGTLRRSEDLLKLLEDREGRCTTAEHYACEIVSLSRCSQDENHDLLVRRERQFLDALGREPAGALFEDSTMELVLLAIRAAFRRCARTFNLSEAVALQQTGRDTILRSSSKLGSQQRTAIAKALDVGLLLVIRDILVKNPAAVGGKDELHETWKQLVDRLHHQKHLSDPITCALALQLHNLAARDGLSSPSAATACFEDARRDGLVPTATLYDLLMAGWAHAKDGTTSERTTQVLAVFNAMRRAGHTPTANSYGHLFTACTPIDGAPSADIDASWIQRVLGYEAEMLQVGLVHSSQSASDIIVSLATGGELEDALQRLVDMRLAGLVRPRSLYTSLFELCARDPASARYVVNDLLPSFRRERFPTTFASGARHTVPDATALEALLACCHASHDVSAALDLLREARIRGKPTALAYARAVSLVEEAGNLLTQERRALADWMAEDGVSAHLQITK
ncbi:hypothetical protein HKX48_000249 [Thoreauomyces humboldtii]|nr:hypothetical protein HKX48_000249 [Thoreauomyces humboldtii]